MIVENEDGTVTVFDLTKEVRLVELEDGTTYWDASPRGIFSEHNIGSNVKMWYTGSGSGHKLNRNQKVTFKATFNRAINYEAGYSGAGYTSIVASSTSASSFNKSVNMPADGTYNFYITNNSSSAVTVRSGEITY